MDGTLQSGSISGLRLQKFVRCAFLIKKVCSVRFLRLQKFVVRFSDILEHP
jgi:hypothetical protein